MAHITFTEGSGLQDSIFGKSQAPIRMFLEKRGESFEQKSMIQELFTVGTSKHWGEKFTTMTAMEGFQPVGENGEYPVDGMQEGFDKFLEHMTWKNSFSLSREIVEDSKLMDLKKQPAAFVAGYYRTRERFGAALFGAAITKAASMKFSGTPNARTARACSTQPIPPRWARQPSVTSSPTPSVWTPSPLWRRRCRASWETTGKFWTLPRTPS